VLVKGSITGCTALGYAAAEGYLEMAELLLANGANVDQGADVKTRINTKISFLIDS
jgi:ankyrin repeat protein